MLRALEKLKASLHFLVNDIFMCFFFGLAIKEVTEALLPGGSLSPLRRATNPLMATLGGVLGPVAAYASRIQPLFCEPLRAGAAEESEKWDLWGIFRGCLCAHLQRVGLLLGHGLSESRRSRRPEADC